MYLFTDKLRCRSGKKTTKETKLTAQRGQHIHTLLAQLAGTDIHET